MYLLVKIHDKCGVSLDSPFYEVTLKGIRWRSSTEGKICVVLMYLTFY